MPHRLDDWSVPSPLVLVLGIGFLVALMVGSCLERLERHDRRQEHLAPARQRSDLDARLEARFERVCPAGWRTRPAPFGNGRVGVNTVFLPADSQTVADRNILEMYFFDADRELADIPRAPGWPDMVWRVSSHDIAPSYPYQSTGMRVCWRLQ